MGHVTMRVLAVTGLKREASGVQGPNVICLASGGDTTRLFARLQAMLTPSVEAIISIGIAGGLDPDLRLGEAVIACAVQGPLDQYAVDAAWSGRLSEALPAARRGMIAGSDKMLATVADKALLRSRTGALCVDMESHIAALAAQVHGLPFAAVRFVSDTAEHSLPPAAQAGMTPEGDMDVAAVLKRLIADPMQLPALLRTGRAAELGFRALVRSRRRLGATLGFADI